MFAKITKRNFENAKKKIIEEEKRNIEEQQKLKLKYTENLVLEEIFKEKYKDILSFEKCDLCKFLLTCDNEETNHCVQFEKLYIEMYLAQKDWTFDWKNFSTRETNSLLEFDIYHLMNIINYLYKQNKARIIDVIDKDNLKKIHNKELLNSERPRIQIIKKILEIREREQFNDMLPNIIIEANIKAEEEKGRCKDGTVF